MNQTQTQEKFDYLAKSFAAITVDDIEVYANGDAPNGKYYRTYNQREALAAIPEARTNRIINKVCDDLGIQYKYGNTWRVNQLEINQIKEFFNSKRKDASQNKKPTQAQIVMIGILKGGVGKTATATMLATGIASLPSKIYKVLVIDLDPQKTASSQLVPNMKANEISIGDLMMDDSDDDTFKIKLDKSIKKTNFPNLDVITSSDRDRQYDIYVRSMEQAADKAGKEYNSYKDLKRVTDALKSRYDIIIIDTPPHFTASNTAAHYVSDHLIMPVKPSEYDWDSAGVYMSFLSRTYGVIKYLGHQGFKSTKLLISSISVNSNAEARTAHKLRLAAGIENCFTASIPRSDAIISCAEQRCTIFDISVSEFDGTKKSLMKAQEAGAALVNEFEFMISDANKEL
ncbi:ParA family protein [Shewanella aestuarii]|uniref:ParA family protein n=1 Tax=Shewanella aestuarii TaxID=1028752 RepID=A0A6G9QQH0_9GAMM|nr:ParA family protein [Shewanella aestuarii]QIR16668.1 ParA family protein [Shewanella aestuarii]